MPTSKREVRKPLLVGEQNPYGGDPYFALYPSPEGCSGHRLCCLILGMDRAAYLEAFERKNLCDGPWCMAKAKARAAELVKWEGPLILLGSKVAHAFGFATYFLGAFEVFDRDEGKTLLLPHPSARCRTWNQPNAVARARALVYEVAPQVAHLLASPDDTERAAVEQYGGG